MASADMTLDSLIADAKSSRRGTNRILQAGIILSTGMMIDTRQSPRLRLSVRPSQMGHCIVFTSRIGIKPHPDRVVQGLRR